MGTRMNKLPYIYTNPHKEAEIFSCDRIFVLSQNPIELEGTNSFRPNKTQEEKNFDKELMKIFRKDIQRLEMSRKDFASRLNGLVKNIGIKTLSFESNVQKLLCCQNDLPEPETTLSSIRSLTLSTHS
jgi:hypothetical protein